MVDLNKNIINGKNGNVKVSKNFIVSLLVVIMVGVAGWAIARVAEMPEKFALKQELLYEVTCLEKEDNKIRKQVERNVDYVIQSINRLDDRMQKRFDNINTKLDSIQNGQTNGADEE